MIKTPTSRNQHSKIVIGILAAFIVGLFLIILALIWALQSASEDIKINVAPSLPNEKQLFGRNTVYPEVAFAYAQLVTQIIRRCPENCLIDYENNLKIVKAYSMVSEDVYADFRSDFEKKRRNGSLKGRTIAVIPLQTVYNKDYVRKLDDGWEVKVDFMLHHYQNSVLVKKLKVAYYFKVSKSLADLDRNRWGLELTAQTRPSVRLK